MNSEALKEITFPVHGMSCGGCVAHVERALKELPGVNHVNVNLAGKQVNIVFDPNKVDLVEFVRAIEDTGYTVPSENALLQVSGMSCMSCVSHVQGAIGDLPGVLNVTVHLSKATAQVKYVPGLVTTAQMIHAVSRNGYQAMESEIHQTRSEQEPAKKHQDSSGSGYKWGFKNLIRKG